MTILRSYVDGSVLGLCHIGTILYFLLHITNYENKLRKWTVAGLSDSREKFQVTHYDSTYGTRNRFSPHRGAIQIQGSFLIHSGPSSLQEYGWGSAGCVEIIGNFSDFKEDIKTVSSIKGYLPSDEIISKLVKEGKLFIEIEHAQKPSITPMSNQFKYQIIK